MGIATALPFNASTTWYNAKTVITAGGTLLKTTFEPTHHHQWVMLGRRSNKRRRDRSSLTCRLRFSRTSLTASVTACLFPTPRQRGRLKSKKYVSYHAVGMDAGFLSQCAKRCKCTHGMRNRRTETAMGTTRKAQSNVSMPTPFSLLALNLSFLRLIPESRCLQPR